MDELLRPVASIGGEPCITPTQFAGYTRCPSKSVTASLLGEASGSEPELDVLVSTRRGDVFDTVGGTSVTVAVEALPVTLVDVNNTESSEFITADDQRINP